MYNCSGWTPEPWTLNLTTWVVALDEEYMFPDEFKNVYEQDRLTRAAIRGFMNYLKTYG